MKQILLALLSITSAANISAAVSEAPKRKSGLWEIQVSITKMPKLQPVQQCVDAATDNLVDQGGINPRDCSKREGSMKGNIYTFAYQCKAGNTVVDTTGTFTGDFNKAYTGEVRSRYTPARDGMGEAVMKVEAKYLGNCHMDQKPGEIVLPGGRIYNPVQAKDAQKNMMK